MAVLHLLLQHDPAPAAHEGLAQVCVKHGWVEGKKFLLVPYHMIGARNMESAILGGYVDHVRRAPPRRPLAGRLPGRRPLRQRPPPARTAGRRASSSPRSARAAGGSKWGKIGGGVDRREVRGRGGGPARRRARAAGWWATWSSTSSPPTRASPGARTEAFLSLDKGLSVISRHAKELGYDALILFLDELILWLASHAADLGFVHRRGRSWPSWSSAQTPDRPVPIVSFVARQRDLRDLVGENVTGAEQLNFADALRHWEGRFHTITLEDRNLPVIAEKRVLRPKDEACRPGAEAAPSSRRSRSAPRS